MRSPLLLIVVALPQSAFAYELAATECDAPLRFDKSTLEYDVVFTDPAFSAHARRAFDQWGMAMRGVLVPVYRGSSLGARSVDERTTIELASDFPFADGDGTIAFTQLFYDCASGKMLDADIILNGENFRYEPETAGAVDPESAIVHEAGHVFGLGHTCGDARGMYPSCFALPPDEAEEILSAVMAPTLSVGTVRRTLLPDDIAGIEARYGVSRDLPVPKITGYSLICPAGAPFLVSVADLPEPYALQIRHTDGSTTAITAITSSAGLELAEPIPADGDLLVVDSDTRAYASLVSPEKPSCDPEPPPPPPPIEENSCGCTVRRRGGRHLDPASWILSMMGFAAALVLRARVRRWLPIALLALVPAEAYAFKCSRIEADTGPSLYWRVREIAWSADSSLTTDMASDTALDQLKLSFQAWEDIECSDVTLPFEGLKPGLKAGFDSNGGENENVVVFIESNWPYDRGVIAVTTNAYDTRSGLVLDSDIEINGEQFAFVVADVACDARQGQMDLRNAITHEVGHMLGLDHPPNTMRNMEVTMYASAPPCETKKRSLALDDTMGICSIYPSGMEVHQCYPPDGPSFVVVDTDDGFGGCTSVERSSLLYAWLAVAAFVFVLRRR